MTRLIDADKLGTAIHDKMKSLPIGLDKGSRNLHSEESWK